MHVHARQRPSCVAISVTALIASLCTACGPASQPAPQGETPSELGVLTQAVCADGPTLEGMDVSRFNGAIDWAGVKAAGKRFAIIQAGRGTSPDPRFEYNWAQAKANGIIRGTYLR